MPLDELAVMEALGGIKADIRAIRDSQKEQGERMGRFEAKLDKETDSIWAKINSKANGNGRLNGYKADAAKVGGGALTGAALIELLRGIKGLFTQ